MDKITIVKVGGKIINDVDLLRDFLLKFSMILGKKILVHGGGRSVDQMLKTLGIEPKMLDGRRITDAATLEICVGQYAGNLNKNIVALLQSMGVDAFGLSGADGGIIKAQKRAEEPFDYGFAGDIKSVEGDKVMSLLQLGFVPVFCALTANIDGQLLNTNADTIVSSIAVELSRKMEVDLRFCFEHAGVLLDIESGNVLNNIECKDYDSYIEQEILQGGIIPKVYNAVQAKIHGVGQVSICGTENLVDLINSTNIL